VLPPYAVPSQVVVLEALPRNINGKVDRRSLPPPPEPAAADADAAQFVAPRGPCEMVVRRVWAGVLGIDEATISVEADWPLLGGNSLLAGRATSLLRKELDVALPSTAMYTHSTVARIAILAESLGFAMSTAADGAEGGASPQITAGELQSEKTTPEGDGEAALCSEQPRSLLLQLLGAVTANFLGHTVQDCLFFALAASCYLAYGRETLFVTLPLLRAALLALQAAVCIGLKWAVAGRLRPGRYPLWSEEYFRWWFVRQVLHATRGGLSDLLGGTALLPAFYRALGARIGARVDMDDPEVDEPDLISIGDDVEIEHQARFGTSAIIDGHLVLGPVEVGSRCRLEARCMLVRGSTVPDGAAVPALASTVGEDGAVGAIAPLLPSHISLRSAATPQAWLRLLVGVPWLLELHSLPLLPVVLALECLWTALPRWGFWATAPILLSHGYSAGFFLAALLQKKLVVGKLAPRSGGAEQGSWRWHADSLLTWLHAQTVGSGAFDDALDPFVGTEVLSCMYRSLGVHVGRRVQVDNFHIVEHDCVAIEDDCVLGSAISMHCSGAEGAREPIRLRRGANLLDHCCVQPGVTVGERAVLGSTTIAPRGACFAPESISTGAVGGRPVRLRFQAITSRDPDEIWPRCTSNSRPAY